MKKLLAIALFLGLTGSIFATPTCTDSNIQGTEVPLYNNILYPSAGDQINTPLVNPIEFSCTINGIEAGEEYYYVLFAYEDSLPDTKSQSLLGKDMFKKNNMILPFSKSNREISTYEYKVWMPSSGPVHLTDADNGTVLIDVWADALGNQPGFEGLAATYPHVFMGICTDPNDTTTCNVIMDKQYAGIGKFGMYILNTEVDTGLLTVSYAPTDQAEVDIYVFNDEAYSNISTLTIEQIYSDELADLLGDGVIAWENIDDLVQPSTNGEVYYHTFSEPFDINEGFYWVWVRYIKKPEEISTKGSLLAMISENNFYYTPVGIEELEIKQLVNSENTVSFECDKNGICNIYDISGRLIESIPFNKTFEHNKTDKKGMYLYNIQTEDGKQKTLKSIGK